MCTENLKIRQFIEEGLVYATLILCVDSPVKVAFCQTSSLYPVLCKRLLVVMMDEGERLGFHYPLGLFISVLNTHFTFNVRVFSI